jgi:hypothetical protein
MIIGYSGYNKLVVDDICVAMCYFNPLQYKKPLRNIQLVQEQFDKYGIPYRIVELVYPNQDPVIKNATIVRSNTVLFSKENLWNIVEKNIPEKYTKIVFMDADIFCSDPNWLNKTSKLLDSNDLVHNMDYLYRDINYVYEKNDIDSKTARYSIIKAIKNDEQINLMVHHTRYVIAINRSFFKKLGGIFEYAITGYGDTLFWSSFIEGYEPYCDNFLKMPMFNNESKKWNEYKENALSISSMDRIAYLPGANILHLRHGTHDNRRYSRRNFYVSGIFNLFHNDDGVLEINLVSKKDKDLLQYWIDRKEDE